MEAMSPTECVYCHATVRERDDVPAAHDHAAWARLAAEHAPTCEWVVTRAHRVFDGDERGRAL